VSENSIIERGLYQIQDNSLYDKISHKRPVLSDSTKNRRSVNWVCVIGLRKRKLIFVCNSVH